ncbi:MAG TPA: TrmH family RNA methyltransferase [Patescibacteria group bacterium]|nr:TrmH family RNA methyltransferase [Patescibacteria group bacterium]
MKLRADKLREYTPSPEEIAVIKRKPIYIIVDNVLDTYNVGAIFRLADAAAVAGVWLIGQTATPDDPLIGHKIHKASIGIWRWIPWKHVATVGKALEDIKLEITRPSTYEAGKSPRKRHTTISRFGYFPFSNQKLNIIAVEQSPNSIPYTEAKYDFPLALILGHETEGVSKEGLDLADAIVEIPMYGVNKSMNVMVSLAIVLWKVMEKST